jgi:hypothetical protein
MYTLQKLKKDLNDAIKTRKQNFKKLSEKFTGWEIAALLSHEVDTPMLGFIEN